MTAPLEMEIQERHQAEERYRSLFNGMTEGFALHELLLDEGGQPCDYRFLDINPAFERLTGLKREGLIGQSQSQVLPDEDPFWLKTYSEVALTGRSIHLEHYSPPLQRHYEVFAYRPAPQQFAVIFTDITQRKQAEEQLAYQAQLLEKMRDAVIATDEQLTITYWSKGAEQTLGWRAAEAIGKHSGDLLQTQVLDSSREQTLQQLKEAGHYEGEVFHRHKDGSYVPVEARTATLTGPQGEFKGFVTSVRDMTERHRAAEALRLNIARLSLALDAAQAGTWEWDLRTDVNIWSDELWKVYGLEPHSCQPSYEAWRQVVHPADRATAERTVQTAARHGAELNFEFRVLDYDGTERTLLSRGRPMLDDNGQVERYIGIVLDITERKQAEETLRASEARFHAIFDQAAVGVAQIASRSGEFVQVNQKYCDIVGYTRQEMLRTSFQKITHPADLAADLQNMQLLLAGEIRTFTMEKRYYRPDGSIVWVNLTVSPMWASGEAPTYHIAVVEDITERKHAEEALRELNLQLEQRVADRTQALTEANARLIELGQLKDQFVARISHELRTPLTIIKLYLDLLQNGKPENQDHYWQVMHDKTGELQQKIEDLLAVSHLTLDKIDLGYAPLAVNTLLHEIMTNRTATAVARHLALTAALAPDLPPVVVDAALLRQAVVNLLNNALGYTPAGGTVNLSSGQRTDAGGEWVTIEVRDSGPGISAHDRTHIFEPFYRGEAARDYKLPGTGVGLFIVQRIVEKLDGRLTVESRPGQGAVFTIWLRVD